MTCEVAGALRIGVRSATKRIAVLRNAGLAMSHGCAGLASTPLLQEIIAFRNEMPRSEKVSEMDEARAEAILAEWGKDDETDCPKRKGRVDEDMDESGLFSEEYADGWKPEDVLT